MYVLMAPDSRTLQHYSTKSHAQSRDMSKLMKIFGVPGLQCSSFVIVSLTNQGGRCLVSLLRSQPVLDCLAMNQVLLPVCVQDTLCSAGECKAAKGTPYLFVYHPETASTNEKR